VAGRPRPDPARARPRRRAHDWHSPERGLPSRDADDHLFLVPQPGM